MVLTKGKSKLAFTLVELVVTIAIIGVLAGILIPSIFGYIKMAKMEGLNNNARTVFLAAQNYLTGWTGDGNDAAALDPDGAPVDLKKILPEVPQKEMDENGGNIRHLALARMDSDGEKRQSRLYQLLSGYISDQLLLEKSILLEYNAKTGQVRSAFVSEEPFLDYAGEDGDPTNVNDRREDALWEKEQGYYGVDYTGSLPERVEDQTLSVRIVNSGGMLGVECDIADYLNAKENTQYEFRVFSLEDPKKGYTFTFDPNAVTDRASAGGTVWAVTYNNAKTAIEKADPARPMVYKTEVDPDGTGHIVWILDVFSEWNAYNSTRDMGIANCYPDLPVGMLDAQVTARAADTGGELAVKQSGNMEHSYFAGQEKGADGSLTYTLRDARQLNNVRYMTNEKGYITGAFKQIGDISMRAFFDQTGDRVLAEGARVTIAPLGIFAGTYSAEDAKAAVGEDGNYKITELMAASVSGQAGLFEENRGSVQNLTVEGAQVGTETVPVRTAGGVIAGTNANVGVLQNCNVSGSVTGGASVGGLAGVNNGKIIGCKSGVFPAPGTANAVQYTYKNTYFYTEKVLRNQKPVEIEKELPCVLSSGQAREKGAAVGGVTGTNAGTVSQCINISQIENHSENGRAGGLVGLNAGGVLKESYNAGRVVAEGDGGSVGGAAGENGARIENCYNTGRINLKDGGKNDPGDDIPLANGMIGGVAGRNTQDGQLADCYAINYIGYNEWQENTVAGGIVGRDETTDPDFITNCSFIPGENLTNALGVSILGARGELRAVYRPEDLADYYTDEPWRRDDPSVADTFYYRYPYLYGLKSEQATPWEQITPAVPALMARMQNGELLTAEWTNGASALQKGISVELLDESGHVLDTIGDISLPALRGITSVREALQNPLTGNSGREYPVFYEDDTYKIVLDGILMDDLQNTIENHFRDRQGIGVRVTYPGEETVVSNLENPLYAGTADEGNQIANARHLYNVRYRSGENFVQTGNIGLHNFDGSEAVIPPIGELTGSYDGGGYSISQLLVAAKTGDAGLFAQVGETAAVRDLALESGVVMGRGNVGGIAGVNYGTVSGCTVKPGVSVAGSAGSAGEQKNIGGVAGLNAGSAAGADRRPVTPADNYLHAENGAWQGSKDKRILYTAGGALPAQFNELYLAFQTLDLTETNTPPGWEKRPDQLGVAVTIEDTVYPLYRRSAGRITALTVADLQGMGEKAAQGYYIRCYLTYDGAGWALEADGLTDQPGYSAYSGEIIGCINEASLAQTADTANAGDSLGGVAGANESIIRDCVSGTVPAAPSMTLQEVLANATRYTAVNAETVGGVTGGNTGEITGCVNAAQVSSAAGSLAGGIAGSSVNLVDRCYNAGTVQMTGASGSVGGVLGKNTGTVTNCYNTGRVNVESVKKSSVTLADGNIGGVIGRNGESAAVNACYNIGYVGDAAGSGSAGGVIGLNKNTSPSAARVQNIYTLAEAALNKNAVGAGTVSGVQDEPVTKDALIAARIGTAFTADAVPVSGTYLYPYPYLRGASAAQRTPWEDTTLSDGLKGSGTYGDPYQVWSADDLQLVEQYDSKTNDAYFQQMEDIDMLGVGYRPIASFKGHFDGAGHIISNLTPLIGTLEGGSGDPGRYAGGLMLRSNGNVRNVCLVNPQIVLSYREPKDAWGNINQLYLGGIVGMTSGRVENCMVIGGSITAVIERDAFDVTAYLGGAVGYNTGGAIDYCGCTADIILVNQGTKLKGSYLGGLSGRSYGSGVSHSYFAGTLGSVETSVLKGGIAGLNEGAVNSCVILEGSAQQAAGSGNAASPVEFCSGRTMASNSILGILGGGVWHFVPESGYPYPLSVDVTAVLPAASFNTLPAEEPSARETAPSPSGGAEPSSQETAEPELSPSLQPELDAAKSSAGSEQTGGEAA